MRGIEIFRSERLNEAGFSIHGFTKRTGGASEGRFCSLNLSFDVGDDESLVRENLKRLKNSIKVDEPLIRIKQTGGCEVKDADELLIELDENSSWAESPQIKADGIVKSGPGAVLAVQTADCVPILLADPLSNVVCALHAGSKGLSKGIVRNGIRKMTEKGADPKRIVAAIGPHICERCYEVGEEVARFFPESSDPIKGKMGKYLLDLGLASEVSLIAAGLSSKNIEQLNACTACLEEELFSHRRDNGATGRQIGFISAKPSGK